MSLTGGAELQDGGGIARARGLVSNVQKCATAPVKRSGIARGLFDYFFFDLLTMVHLG